jgi:hypothetical protein
MTKQIIIKKFKTLKVHFEGFQSLDELIKKDSRGIIFAIEGILRLYIRHANLSEHEEEVFTKAFNFTKKIEDLLGEVFFHQEILEYYKKQSFKKINNLENKKNKEFKKLEKYLKSNDFKKEFNEIVSLLSRVDFKKEKFIVKAIKKEIKRIDNKINDKLSKLIFKEKYTHFEIEEGVHEWRRMIRWIALYLQGHKHLFKLKIKNKHKHLPLVKKYKNNKFCILGQGKITINAKHFYELSDYIVKVGDLKTKAEIPWFLKQNYKVNIIIPRIEKESIDLLNEFKKTNLLKKFLKEL